MEHVTQLWKPVTAIIAAGSLEAVPTGSANEDMIQLIGQIVMLLIAFFAGRRRLKG